MHVLLLPAALPLPALFVSALRSLTYPTVSFWKGQDVPEEDLHVRELGVWSLWAWDIGMRSLRRKPGLWVPSPFSSPSSGL